MSFGSLFCLLSSYFFAFITFGDFSSIFKVIKQAAAINMITRYFSRGSVTLTETDNIWQYHTTSLVNSREQEFDSSALQILK